MTLIYAGVDLSAFTTKYGFTETPREVEGPNSGTSISGLGISDIVAMKFDPTFVLRPLNTMQVQMIWNLLRAVPVNTYRTLRYTNPEGTLREISAKLTNVGAASKVLENRSRTLYDGVVITFMEQ